MALLEVRGLEKWYGRRQVVNGVDFDVEPGRGRRPARTQRRRQNHQLPHDDRPHRRRRRQGRFRRPGRHSARHVSAAPRGHGLSGAGLQRVQAAFRRRQPDGDPRDPPHMIAQATRGPPERAARSIRPDQDSQDEGEPRLRRRAAAAGDRPLADHRTKLIMLDEPFAGIDPKTVAEIQDQIRDLVETLQHRHPADRPPVPRDARSHRPQLRDPRRTGLRLRRPPSRSSTTPTCGGTTSASGSTSATCKTSVISMRSAMPKASRRRSLREMNPTSPTRRTRKVFQPSIFPFPRPSRRIPTGARATPRPVSTSRTTTWQATRSRMIR